MMQEEEKINIASDTDETNDVVISIKDLCKSFGDNHVLNNFSFELKKGENVVVLGKSGSGKSVLIKCVIGLLKPDSGIINVFGKNIPELSSDELDKLRVRIGFLFQSNALYDSMTVRENLEFPLRRHKQNMSKEERDSLVAETLTNVGLAHTTEMMPSELSGGMRKRIALARTLILKPEVILYDEPTTGLDSITSREIINLMLELQKKYNSSSLVISHDMNCVEKASDRVIMLIDGKCYEDGPIEQIKQSKDEKVKQFFI
jgi:phospholipid/cholesterol/gamma-HCH transport system ATP-binding protein